MPKKNIITNQQISPELKQRAEELRKNMTPAEAKLWQHLKANRLAGYPFRRQQVIDGYIVDFYCHAVDLVVEVDGDIHLEQQEYDCEREAYLKSLGLKVLRFNNFEVQNDLNLVLGAIREACRIDGGRNSEINSVTC